MIKVSNKKCIRNLSKKSLYASKTRNIIAVIAIALTAILFTALFTISMSINDSFQQQNFRQAGSFAHGSFKYLTEKQFDALKEDSLISEWGLRRFLGMPTDIPFNKNQVEIGYSDKKQAHWMFCDPVEGRLPKEGTNEAATDKEVLKLLGLKPKLGEEFTVTFYVDGKKTTQTFTLSGWWDKDEVIVANHILVPESRVDAVLKELSVPTPAKDHMTGSYNMDVMLGSARHIEKDMNKILSDYGYQSERRNDEKTYIATGINWGYTGTQLSESIDPQTVIAIGAMLLLIIFTGYLIIYNVFQISVVGDIRFYGMLKTIGTTGKQIKRIIRRQALLLSGIGIPVGLIFGWLVGSALTPVVLNQLDGMAVDIVSVNPVIFVVSALFALITVMLSASRPARVAAKISPVEAVRYTENQQGKQGKRKNKKAVKKGRKGVSLFAMAKANLGRSKGKTTVTVLSLSLAVVLLNMTVMFAGGFDMDKYLEKNSVCDFILADAAYFQTGQGFSKDNVVTPDVMNTLAAQKGISEGGKVYGQTSDVKELISEDYFRRKNSLWSDEENIKVMLENAQRDAHGRVADDVQLSGMEPFALDKLKVFDGDIKKLYEPGKRYIAAVYAVDDYGNLQKDSHWAKVGDKVTFRYVEKSEYYNPSTGEVYKNFDDIGDQPYRTRAVKYKDVEYEVAALVDVPYAFSYRYYGDDEFVMNDKTFLRDTGTSDVMLYAFDTTKASNSSMENFLADYTKKINPSCDYESKATYQEHFEGFRNMFMILGGVLSFIVGFIGILNFFNAILTGIVTRKREFAMLQSIGMTGKQLKKMLVYEGLLYALASIICSLGLTLIMGPVASSVLSNMFWFFTYHLTLAPIAVVAPIFAFLGCIIPLFIYRTVSKQTIVERLRVSEN